MSLVFLGCVDAVVVGVEDVGDEFAVGVGVFDVGLVDGVYGDVVDGGDGCFDWVVEVSVGCEASGVGDGEGGGVAERGVDGDVFAGAGDGVVVGSEGCEAECEGCEAECEGFDGDGGWGGHFGGSFLCVPFSVLTKVYTIVSWYPNRRGWFFELFSSPSARVSCCR